MFIDELTGLLLPALICVVLPVMIVWLTMRARQHETDKKTEIMLKAIESGASIDTEFFRAEQPRVRSLKEKMLGRLTGACITSFLGIAAFIGSAFFQNLPFISWPLPIVGGILLAVGLGLFVTYFVGKKMLAKEIEAEEQAALDKPRQ